MDLLEEEETDDYGILRPTQLAFKSAMRFVVEAYERLGDRFPKASTDADRGIRLTWSRLAPDCEVRLVCPATGDQASYLYHELQDDYAVEREVTVLNLVQWLNQA